MSDKIKLATASLCGCFGCHMSFLDIDEKLEQLVEVIEFNRSPLTDIKDLSQCDIGLIEGGIANQDNLEVLQDFRRQCKILVAVGACAMNGGIPSMRNSHSLESCLTEAYVDGIGVTDPGIPADPEIPLLLDKVYPLHEVVKIDYFLPGCPPPAEAFWTFLNELIQHQQIAFPYHQRHFD